MHIVFLTSLTVSFLKKIQISDFPSAIEATSAVEAEGELEGGSEEKIKSVDGVSVCVNGSIGVSSKGICKSYHSWLFKSKALYLEEEEF